MLYRIIKKRCWWTGIFDTGTPQYLYWDERLERFEVGSVACCLRCGRYKFTKEEIVQMRKDYNLDDEFLIEEVKRSKNDN